jgi:hypothetical protein
MMDVRTKVLDHTLYLEAVVEEEGNDPARVEAALREGPPFAKASYDHCNEWNDRFTQTHGRFPFVLHTACDDCLRAGDRSLSAILNRQYEDLAAEVSPELHLMVRWGAQALAGRSDLSY